MNSDDTGNAPDGAFGRDRPETNSEALLDVEGRAREVDGVFEVRRRVVQQHDQKPDRSPDRS